MFFCRYKREPKGCHMDGTKGMSHGRNQRDVTWTEPKGCHMDGTKGMSHGPNTVQVIMYR